MAELGFTGAGIQKVLDFDVETVAAGFADPQWVPQKITCVAWSWVGSDKVESRVCGPLGLYGMTGLRKKMLEPLLEEIAKADMVTGHNLLRFDLPVINSECMRLGLEPIRQVLVQDTMRLVRSKGFKKGQDNLARLKKVRTQKMPLDWQAWQDAYDEIGPPSLLLRGDMRHVWPTVRLRAETDIVGHKEVREALLADGVVKPPTWWRG